METKGTRIDSTRGERNLKRVYAGGGMGRRLLYAFTPQEEAEAPQVAENGQTLGLELAEV